MTGEENIKMGDKLICITNDDIESIVEGSIITIYAVRHTGKIRNTGINITNKGTGWRRKDEFNWHCYNLIRR